MASEKFCLRWNDFESNVSHAFRELREDKDFFDVTLACEDDQLQAHKVILSACSPFFRNILRRNPHQNPLLYLKGVKYSDLLSVLNFMYHGEVNVAQEELNSFLAVAEDLMVKGLSTSNAKPDRVSRPKTPQQKSIIRPPDPDPHSVTKRTRIEAAQVQSLGNVVSRSIDDDIQEVVPVKTEPRDAPPQATPSVYQPQSSQPVSQALAPVEQSLDTMGNQEDFYEDYGQYETEQYDTGAVGTDHDMVMDGTKGKYQFLESVIDRKLRQYEGECM